MSFPVLTNRAIGGTSSVPDLGTTETPDARLRLPRCLDQLHDLSPNQHTLLGLVGKNGLAVHHHVQYTSPG
jgi:hypothetical protein